MFLENKSLPQSSLLAYNRAYSGTQFASSIFSNYLKEFTIDTSLASNDYGFCITSLYGGTGQAFFTFEVEKIGTGNWPEFFAMAIKNTVKDPQSSSDTDVKLIGSGDIVNRFGTLPTAYVRTGGSNSNQLGGRKNDTTTNAALSTFTNPVGPNYPSPLAQTYASSKTVFAVFYGYKYASGVDLVRVGLIDITNGVGTPDITWDATVGSASHVYTNCYFGIRPGGKMKIKLIGYF